MSRIWEDDVLAAEELQRVQDELTRTQEGIRAWVAAHRGELSHTSIVELLTLAGMKII